MMSSVEEKIKELEKRKLEKEVNDFTPHWLKISSILIPGIVAVITIGQYLYLGYFEHQRTLIEIKKYELTAENAALESRRQEIEEQIEILEAENLEMKEKYAPIIAKDISQSVENALKSGNKTLGKLMLDGWNKDTANFIVIFDSKRSVFLNLNFTKIDDGSIIQKATDHLSASRISGLTNHVGKESLVIIRPIKDSKPILEFRISENRISNLGYIVLSI